MENKDKKIIFQLGEIFVVLKSYSISEKVFPFFPAISFVNDTKPNVSVNFTIDNENTTKENLLLFKELVNNNKVIPEAIIIINDVVREHLYVSAKLEINFAEFTFYQKEL